MVEQGRWLGFVSAGLPGLHSLCIPIWKEANEKRRERKSEGGKKKRKQHDPHGYLTK